MRPGSPGDATLLSLREGRFNLHDTVGEHLTAMRRLFSEGVVLAGRWWHPNDPAQWDGRSGAIDSCAATEMPSK